MLKCVACENKIKISQVVMTAPQGDICRDCVRNGWEFYETGTGLGLRRLTRDEREAMVVKQLPMFAELT